MAWMSELSIPLSNVFYAIGNKLGLTAVPLNRIYESVIWDFRLSRALVAACCGAGLAICGAVLQSLLPKALVSATKGCTGHTLGAAGAIEAVITVSCLVAGDIPPSPGFAAPHPELGLAPVSRTTTLSCETRVCGLSQSLAFGGNNAAVIFGRGA